MIDRSEPLVFERFPRASRYNPDWVLSAVSGGTNPLLLTEWLPEAVDLRSGMLVLDLGCGRALSSIFLRREFGVEVWAADLWFSPTENLQRIQDAEVADSVYPLRADARSLLLLNSLTSSWRSTRFLTTARTTFIFKVLLLWSRRTDALPSPNRD